MNLAESRLELRFPCQVKPEPSTSLDFLLKPSQAWYKILFRVNLHEQRINWRRNGEDKVGEIFLMYNFFGNKIVTHLIQTITLRMLNKTIVHTIKQI